MVLQTHPVLKLVPLIILPLPCFGYASLSLLALLSAYKLVMSLPLLKKKKKRNLYWPCVLVIHHLLFKSILHPYLPSVAQSADLSRPYRSSSFVLWILVLFIQWDALAGAQRESSLLPTFHSHWAFITPAPLPCPFKVWMLNLPDLFP